MSNADHQNPTFLRAHCPPAPTAAPADSEVGLFFFIFVLGGEHYYNDHYSGGVYPHLIFFSVTKSLITVTQNKKLNL